MLSDRRLVIFCGKGGVGKTVLAAAYARMLPQSEKVLFTSLSSLDYAESLFGVAAHETLTRVNAGLFLLKLDAMRVLEEMLRERVPRLVANQIIGHPVYHAIVNATPGLQDVLTLTTLASFYSHESDGRPTYDRVVVDGMATGHMKSLFVSPAQAMRMIPRGGLHELARRVDAIFKDQKNTEILVATTLEEMPVNETVELVRFCDDFGLLCRTVAVNQLQKPLMGRKAWALFQQLEAKEDFWRQVEEGLQRRGYPFQLSERFFRALRVYEEGVKEQDHYLDLLQKSLPDKGILEVPFFLEGGASLLDEVGKALK